MGQQANATIPIIVRQHLAHKSIAHALGPNKPNLNRAEVCLLNDDQGMVQVFVRSGDIVELDKVRACTDRSLNPMTQSEIAKLKKKLGVETLPAFDDFIQAQTIIDTRLFDAAPIYIHSGASDQLLAVKDGNSLRRKDDTQIASVASELPLQNIDYELSLFDHDREQINSAVTRFTALRIRQRLEETLEVPPLPDTAQAIIRLRVDPDANIEKLSQIVERDPSLAAQVVSWASSSYYSAPGSIKSVQDAIVRVLGYDLVMNLALGLSLGKSLELPQDNDHGFPSYWHQAVYVAACVGTIVSAIPREFRPGFGLSYLSGLLHNFGYLIMAHAFRPHFETTNAMISLNRHLNHQHIEKHVLGITRDQIAASLMHSWNMPGEVTMGVRYQSDPQYLGINSDQAHLIYLARHLLSEYNMIPAVPERFDDSVYEHLSLDPKDVVPLMEQLRDNQAELDMIATSLTPD
ncbi:aminoacyl-tRNA deacylase and HDOD domain-containing protein [Reinekea blandensis]|uniref:Predicted signal transduction protein n=1 Tax=Reinekea blandensis MED297 TaxID=314283 RepID=A4BIV9_9GAMM|nr:HDOD domain-containing protein [Reinekea blandensis]EAR07976.1 predicted signal transduction protein [Reinekea sp. MED297] [Reinekea blandensis MED297]